MAEPITNLERVPNEHHHVDAWRTANLVVLGMTYPAYSQKYKELVCVGAIDEATGEIIRIYPMPKRYMDVFFKSFQRIEVRVRSNPYDGRPDSIRVDFDSVKPLDEIPAKNHEARRRWIEQSPSLAASVEELQERNARDRTSLGVIKPKSIDRVHIRKRTATERAQWFATEKKLMDQTTLPLVLRPTKRLDFPEAEFVIEWTCNDERCTGHKSGLKSWGIHELYRKLKSDPERDAKTKAQLLKMLDMSTRDVFLFLGTFHNHQTTWGLMEIYSPPKRKADVDGQLGLFSK